MTSSTPKTTLITGANGLVGSHLVRRYLQAGQAVAALHRPTSDLTLLQDVQDRITWLEGDVLDIPSLTSAIESLQPAGSVDVIHAAAVVSYSPKDRERMEKVNVEGTTNVVNVGLQQGIRKLGFVSSVASLGRPAKINPGDATITIDETQRWEESPNNAFYAQTKYRAELEVWRSIAEGLNAVMINPSLVLGEGDWTKSSAQLFKYAYDERPFYPSGALSVVDVEDVAEALFQLMQSDVSAERFILSAQHLPYKELFDKIADAFGKKHPSIHVSPGLTRLLWPLEAVRARLMGKTPLITRETARTASSSFRYNGHKIESAIPFRYRNLDETILRISAFFKRTR